jgi:hypothetical protein
MNDVITNRLSSCPAFKDSFIVVTMIRCMWMPWARLQISVPISSPLALKTYMLMFLQKLQAK